jgi:1,4-dihydroxy-2-naphthoate octaprenyltransferase
MDKTKYGFGIVLLLAEVLIVILMAATTGYHPHAKATDNVGNNNNWEENIIRTKHAGKCNETCKLLIGHY